MINIPRNSSGFTNLVPTKKVPDRSPYSTRFQPLLSPIEALERADASEPVSHEGAFPEFSDRRNHDEDNDGGPQATEDLMIESLEVPDDLPEPSAQSRVYSGTGHMATSSPTSDLDPAAQVASQPAAGNPDDATPESPTADTTDQPVDDPEGERIVATLVADLSEKIDAAFASLEDNILGAIEGRIGRAMQEVLNRSLAEETVAKLDETIRSIVRERGDSKVVIRGPQGLIETFQAHRNDEGDTDGSLSFVTDQTCKDLIVQIDEVSIMSRFDELDDLVAEIFKC